MQTVKILLYGIRALVVSLEFLTIVIGVAVHSHFPSVEQGIADVLTKDAVVQYLCFVPAALLVWIAPCVGSVLSPEHSKRELLNGWKERYILKTYSLVALLYALACAGSGIYILAKWDVAHRGSWGLALTVVICVSILSAASAYLAKHKLIEMLDGMQ